MGVVKTHQGPGDQKGENWHDHGGPLPSESCPD